VVAYLEGIGANRPGNNDPGSRRDNIVRGMTAIRAYEQQLSRAMLDVLHACGAVIYGVGDAAQVERRVPTFGFTIPGHTPASVVERMAEAGIGIRDGHMYTPRLMRRLGVSPEAGIIRTSLVHYNTVEEIDRFGEVLRTIVGRAR
jgi:selenocysteine lyase/cysteine desulfurase